MRRKVPERWWGYEQFFFTLTGRTCERCGQRPEFIDTPGLCVECAAREEQAKRLRKRRAEKTREAADTGCH